MSDEISTYYTQEEIAELLGVTIFAVRKWRRVGKLGFMRVGRTVRISRKDLNAFLAAHDYPATWTPEAKTAV